MGVRLSFLMYKYYITAGNFQCLVANIVKTLLKNWKFWAGICASNIVKTLNKISALSYQGRLKTFYDVYLIFIPKNFAFLSDVSWLLLLKHLKCFWNGLCTALTEQHWIFSWFCRKTIVPPFRLFSCFLSQKITLTFEMFGQCFLISNQTPEVDIVGTKLDIRKCWPKISNVKNIIKQLKMFLVFLGRIIEKSYYMFLQCWKHKYQLRIFSSSTIFSQCLQPSIGNCLLCILPWFFWWSYWVDACNPNQYQSNDCISSHLCASGTSRTCKRVLWIPPSNYKLWWWYWADANQNRSDMQWWWSANPFTFRIYIYVQPYDIWQPFHYPLLRRFDYSTATTR